ncbi:MAG: hypothetical protein ABI210_03785, partial [Abditibacteriaceae bacterium]
VKPRLAHDAPRRNVERKQHEKYEPMPNAVETHEKSFLGMTEELVNCLTLELSGGEAVRLNEWLGGDTLRRSVPT